MANIRQLLIEGLGALPTDMKLEQTSIDVRGRIDGLLGRTVLEFKSDLRRELGDAHEQLVRYLGDKQAAAAGERYIGITTDGATFLAYQLHNGELSEISKFVPDLNSPEDLLTWLGRIVLLTAEIAPEPDAIREELGKGSPTYAVARLCLADAWAAVKDVPDVRLKRDLWARLLSRVYGTRIDADDLFFQHTYLTIVAKTTAASALGIALPAPSDLLSGQPFAMAGIHGAVESDFFDWVLAAPGHDDLIRRIEQQVARFKLRDVQHDVMKVLYESLIDPETRHDLGEYYTPDWLAELVCGRAIERPLEQRVLDPACGSGTFLFQAVRRYIAAAKEADQSPQDALIGCCSHVFGIDVHPVAAIIARVTYLLALGDLVTSRDRLTEIHLPVYLGDALQWDVREMMGERPVEIRTRNDEHLYFPYAVVKDIRVFEDLLASMLQQAEQNTPLAGFQNRLRRESKIATADQEALGRTYEHLRSLYAAAEDHIWGYVVRNLSRPVWLSTPEQRADVLVGNPPWLSYRFMDAATQQRFKVESERRGVWAGGRYVPQQDLSGYFFARATELYLKLGGLIAFVMPYAAMSRGQSAGFRRGWFAGGASSIPMPDFATVRFEEGWSFDESVYPVFPVPACVLIARRGPNGPLPATVTAYTGQLPRRDLQLADAQGYLSSAAAPWPSGVGGVGVPASVYKGIFRNGATVFPRLLFMVERAPAGRLGVNASTPALQSLRSKQEKPPWKALDALEGRVESTFVRSLYLGESIAPYRLLQPLEAVIPWTLGHVGLLNASGARVAGYPGLAGWLTQAEALWQAHGTGRITLQQQLDYYGKLSAQLPPAPLRVVYGKAGSEPAAAILQDSSALCDHTLYWAPISSLAEARYLCSVLNSETLRARIAHWQSRGQWGARHFDKYLLEAPIPRFNPRTPLHRALVQAAERAEAIAALVALKDAEYFTRVRGHIRTALRADGSPLKSTAWSPNSSPERVMEGGMRPYQISPPAPTARSAFIAKRSMVTTRRRARLNPARHSNDNGSVTTLPSITPPANGRRPLKLLHTADVHLGLDLDPARAATGFRGAIDLAIAHAVDAVIIAGDLFDHSRVTAADVEFAAAQINRLAVPCVLLPGNHDQFDERSVYRRFDLGGLCPGLRLLLEPEGEQFTFDTLDLTLWGRAMVDHHPGFHPLDGSPNRGGHGWHVALAHGFHVPAGYDTDRSSPIRGEEIAELGWDYLALGHVHRFRDCSAGATMACYPGAPFTYEPGSDGEAVLVHLHPQHGVSMEPLAVPTRRAAPAT